MLMVLHGTYNNQQERTLKLSLMMTVILEQTATFTFDKDTIHLISNHSYSNYINTGLLGTAAQTNITTVGTLGALTVTGAIGTGSISATGELAGADLNMSGNAIITGNLTS